MSTGSAAAEVFEVLLAQHGAQHWWPAETPFEIMVGAVLVQNTAWRGAAQAIEALKAAALIVPERILAAELTTLEGLIRPAGTYRVKARRLRALCAWLLAAGGQVDGLASEDTTSLRRALLAVHGVGHETADDILLYALGRPVFIADAYARRILHRLGLCEAQVGYEHLQQVVQPQLSADVELLGEFHALLVVHGRQICRPRPRCGSCDLQSRCPTGLRTLGPRLSRV
ncbi:MAG: endonuclease [Gammaproteobacteria bacterium]|nr:endonuclease [Gammaproteobacteria bacterium]